MIKKILKNHHGFTLFEIITSLSLFILVIILVNSLYLISQKTYNKNSDLAELTQNARVSLDRLSREIRQSVSIITLLPPTESDPTNPPTNELFFQNGHDISRITYIRYYLNGTNLMRQFIAFYFTTEPDVYVTYNSVDQFGESPEELIIDDRIVGEYFSTLEFWGADGLVNISLELTKNQNHFSLQTEVFSRNW